RDVDVLLQFGHIEVCLVGTCVEYRQHELWKKRPGERAGSEQSAQWRACRPEAAGQTDIWKKRRAGGADVRIGRAQLSLGLLNVGTTRQQVRRQSGRNVCEQILIT